MSNAINFTAKDIQQIEQLGLSVDEVKNQISIITKGNCFVHVIAPATSSKGIQVLTKEELNQYIVAFDKEITDKKLLKFVPASGAATRMFKDIFNFYEKYTPQSNETVSFLKQGFLLIKNLDKFAFYQPLKQSLAEKNINIEKLLNERDYKPIVQDLLFKEGLNYASLPKGVLIFHQYAQELRTAFEEHLVEGSLYAKNTDNKVYLHFTISPEHTDLFNRLSSRVVETYEKRFKVNYSIDFSYQSLRSNTIALTEDNQLFRNEDRSLEFRPGGHGSLLENLSSLKADVIFIKNIDNVTTDERKDDTIVYKKVLTVLLLQLQRQCFKYLEAIENKTMTTEELLDADAFIQKDLQILLSENYHNLNKDSKQNILFDMLNRPIRVCGMVKREDEPGGGPFWTKDTNGKTSLQIVETSEINLNDSSQLQILENSEYFNPVDLVCGIKNYKGEKFNLLKYTDKSRYFISLKSKNGKNLKSLEHPGLWNGAMSDWITLFVAVPLSTFTPVKTVNDLLRKEHLV